MSSANTYEGEDIEVYRDYTITYSRIRPVSMRYEASRREGDKSLFADSVPNIKYEIDDQIFEKGWPREGLA